MIIRVITKSRNRFNVFFENGKLLKLECNNGHYQGSSSWADFWGVNDLDIEAGEIWGEKIVNYPDLPTIVRAHIERVLAENGSG